jgi:glycosyltransferase involved in cell wall biosynthesis
MSLSSPKVSVVTVVRNSEESIEKTIKSVFSQDYSNLEYIVIDGASTDSTLTILETYRDHINILISEADNGIFDAMNKAIPLASGDWIIFMNSGDYFYDRSSLSQLSHLLKSDVDVILAGCEKILIDDLETRHFQILPGNIANVWKHMPTVHQSTIVRLTTQKQYKFNTNYQWCADHDALARMYHDNKKFVSSESLFCYFDCSGGQKRDPLLFIKERWSLSQDLVPFYTRFFFYGLEVFHCIIWGAIVTYLKQIIPKSLLLKLRRYRKTSGIDLST